MKNLLIMLLVVVLMATCTYQERHKTKDNQFKLNNDDIAVIIPELHSIAELQTIFKSANIAFNPEIINQTQNVSMYFGPKKIAANIGVYMADLLYVMSTKEKADIEKEYGAIFKLANKYGFENELYKITTERYENDGVKLDDLYNSLAKSLENSSREMDESEVSEFSSYLIFGNYIEKLFIISKIVQQDISTVDSETVEETKMKLLGLLSKQSVRINQLVYVLSKYPNNSVDVVDLDDLELLFNNYLDVEANRDELLDLNATQICQSEKIISIFNQIEKIRNRLVLL